MGKASLQLAFNKFDAVEEASTALVVTVKFRNIPNFRGLPFLEGLALALLFSSEGSPQAQLHQRKRNTPTK